MSSTKPNYKKPSLIEILKIYGYVFKLNLQKQKRDYDLIDQGYNSGLWNKKFEEIDFESPQGNYSRTDSEDVVVMCYEGKMVKAKMQDFLMKRKSEFLEFFDEFDKMQTIVELGCGLGFNLFNLHRIGFKKLEGYDLSKNSIENLQKYVKMNDYDMYFDVCDLNKAFSKNMIKDKVVFTRGCLEQCKHIMQNALKNICNGYPKLVINFEVDYDASPYIVKKYLDSRDYQNNLVKELKILEKNGDIELVSIKKFKYSISPVNRSSAIMWKPKCKN